MTGFWTPGQAKAKHRKATEPFETCPPRQDLNSRTVTPREARTLSKYEAEPCCGQEGRFLRHR